MYLFNDETKLNKRQEDLRLPLFVAVPFSSFDKEGKNSGTVFTSFPELDWIGLDRRKISRFQCFPVTRVLVAFTFDVETKNLNSTKSEKRFGSHLANAGVIRARARAIIDNNIVG